MEAEEGSGTGHTGLLRASAKGTHGHSAFPARQSQVASQNPLHGQNYGGEVWQGPA